MTDSDRPILEITYTTSMSDLLLGTAELSRTSLVAVVGGLAILAMGAISLVVGDPVWATASLVVGLSIATGFYTTPFMWLALRGRREIMAVPATLRATSDALSIQSVTGLFSAEWSSFRDARELRRLVAVRAPGGGAHLIPKRAFSADELERFRALLASKGLLRRRG